MFRTNSPGAIGGIICRDASTGGGQKLWYHFDRLGNVMAVSDSNGRAYAVYTMEAFGTVLEKGKSTGYLEEYGTDPQPYHLTTKEYDPDSGLYYFNARWYEPGIGRFLSRAWFRPDIEHPYVIVENDPIGFVDPAGTRVQRTGTLKTKRCDECQRKELYEAAKDIATNLPQIGNKKVQKCIADRILNRAIICGGLWCLEGKHGYRKWPYRNIHICSLAFDKVKREYSLPYTLLHEWLHSCGVDADKDSPEDQLYPGGGI